MSDTIDSRSIFKRPDACFRFSYLKHRVKKKIFSNHQLKDFGVSFITGEATTSYSKNVNSRISLQPKLNMLNNYETNTGKT